MPQAQSTTPTAPKLGSPAAEPDLEGLDAAILEGEREHGFTERQNRATAAAAQGTTVIPEVTSPREQAMLDAAAGRKVAAVSFEDPSRSPAVLGGSSQFSVQAWNGTPTRFTLAHPVMHNQRLLREGETIEFDVNPVMVTDPETGRLVPNGAFVGSGGPDDQSEHVGYLYQMGIFKGTTPSDIREGRQAAVDHERGALEPTRIGADESGNPIVQPAMRSLMQPTGAMMEQRLRQHRGIASPAAMLAAERMASMSGAEAPGSAGPRPQRSE